MSNKDRNAAKKKKREAEEKLRQHLEKDTDATIAVVAEALLSSQSAQAVLKSSTNAKDAAALYFMQQQQQRMAQQKQQKQQQQGGGGSDGNTSMKNNNNTNNTNNYNEDEDDDDDDDEARNVAIDNARMARLGAASSDGPTQSSGNAQGTTNKNSTCSGNARDKNNNNSGGEGTVANTNNKNSTAPKRRRFDQEEMKLSLEKALGRKNGTRLIPFVDEHTGSAPEPFVCAQIRSSPHNVPVPAHWDSVSAYLSSQIDRPPCKVMLKEVAASGVEFARKGKNERPDARLFAKAFLDGNPLKVNTYGIRLMEKGATYEGTRWKPTVLAKPGVISEELRKALGMLNANSPPPWIHSMQRRRELPPSYPYARYVGLNAPIPEGAQWGYARGQWGEPVRKPDGTFLYPAVQSLGINTISSSDTNGGGGGSRAEPPFGFVPPRRRTDTKANDAAAGGGGAAGAAGPQSTTTIVNADAAKKAAAAAAIAANAPASFNSLVSAARTTTTTAVPQIVGSLQFDQYVLDVTADDDDLLSAGKRLVNRKPGAL